MSICRTECPSIWLSVSLHPFPIVPLSDFSNLPPTPLPRPHLGLSPLSTPHIHMKLSPGDLPARKRSHLLSHAEALSRQPPLSLPSSSLPHPHGIPPSNLQHTAAWAGLPKCRMLGQIPRDLLWLPTACRTLFRSWVSCSYIPPCPLSPWASALPHPHPTSLCMAPCSLENSYLSSRRGNPMKSGQMGLASQSRGRAGHGPTGGDFSGHSQPRGGATGCLHLILSLQARLGSSCGVEPPVPVREDTQA